MSSRAIEIILSRQLADCLNVPVFLVDPKGNLMFYNAPAEGLLGRRFEETGEMPMEMWSTAFFPTDEDGNAVPPEQLPLVTSIQKHVPAHKTFWVKSFDGRSIQISVTAIPIIGRDQEFVGAIAIFWDNPIDI
ncbi:MAG: PAS domain-containing protein [Flavobacteriaceae bacterium]|nr:PAS domain-containing protein [Flavobacteriaceae bacterium]MDH3796704.1 PAS domain-containing protein [Flavobacteriaceae bacterium]